MCDIGRTCSPGFSDVAVCKTSSSIALLKYVIPCFLLPYISFDNIRDLDETTMSGLEDIPPFPLKKMGYFPKVDATASHSNGRPM